jgi:ATP-dependent Clp protease ATP-binding subunit ClpA
MNNFTPRAQQALALARKEAYDLKHDYVGNEHLLPAIVRLRQGVAYEVLLKRGITLERLRDALRRDIAPGKGRPEDGKVPYTPMVKKSLALALKEAKELGSNYVGTDHILLGILRAKDELCDRMLALLGADIEGIRSDLINELRKPGTTDLESVEGYAYGDVGPLTLIIDHGSAPSEVIADILSDISLLYRKAGGAGINFVIDRALVPESDLL